jgi:hypothetical protein
MIDSQYEGPNHFQTFGLVKTNRIQLRQYGLIAVGVGDVVECAASLIQLVAKKKGTVRIKLTHLLIFSIV